MKKSAFFILACMFMLTVAASAFAAEPGFYAGVNGGLIVPTDRTYKFDNSVVGPVEGNVSNKVGFAIGAVGGYAFKNNIRVDLEIGYKRADTEKFVSVDLNSTVSIISELISVYYDFKTPYTFGIIPYVGAGIGDAYLMTTNGTNPNINTNLVNDSSDAAFAYQIAAGAAYEVTPKITADLGYRYFGTTEVTFKGGDPGMRDAKTSYSSHNVIVGARYKF